MEPSALRNSVPPERAVPFFGFVAAVVLLAAACCVPSLTTLPALVARPDLSLVLMAVLAVLSDVRPFAPPVGRRTSSAVYPSVCFTFAIMLEWGLGAAVTVQAVAVVVAGLLLRHAAWRMLFNLAQYALALAAAYAVTGLVPGGPFGGAGRPGWAEVGVLAAAALAWFAVKYVSLTTALALRFGTGWGSTLRQGLLFELLATGALLLLAPVLAAAARTSPALIPLIMVPLYAVHRMARLTTEQKELAARDPLTGLANRKALLTAVAQEVRAHGERATRGMADSRFALLLIDLDRFKHVNDALGHAVGDRLLVEVGKRLRATLRPGDVIARLGGDEFAIVATGLRDDAQARQVADCLVRALTEPVPIDGLPLDVGGSIGVALFPEHGEDFTTLMRHVDVAMYDAKHRGDSVAVYSPESDHNSPERLNLLADLRRVLEGDGTAPKPGGTGTPSPESDPDEPGPRTGPPVAARQRTAGAQGEIRSAVPDPAPGEPSHGGGDRRAGSRWGAWRRSRAAEVVNEDELLKRIVTSADPRGRSADAALRAAGPPGLVAVDRAGPATGQGADRETPAQRPAESATRPAAPAATVTPAAPAAPAGAAAAATVPAGPGRPAVDVGEITMYYQPQINIASGRVVGVEALLRWHHPTRGRVDPEELIRVAEQSPVMRLLTRRVVDDVVNQLARWLAAGVDVRAALNVSVRDLHTGEIADQIAALLHRHDIPPDRLQVEITEGALMADPRRVLATISRLHQIGVAISLDDFGTGYSSMLHLRRLPLAEVKIDRSFVLGMSDDADDAAIVRSMIDLARALGLRVVAEGVEDERTWRLLHEAGCEAAQGWFYARPMPADELTEWLARYRPLTPAPTPDPAPAPVPDPAATAGSAAGPKSPDGTNGRHRRRR